MNDIYIFTGGSGKLGSKYIEHISKFNKEILNIDLFENQCAKYNIIQDLRQEKVILQIDDFLKNYEHLNSIKFIHLAGIVGESLKNNWVTDIDNLGINISELCYSISVTIPAKLISVFTKYSKVEGVYINSIYGTYPPDFSIYKNDSKLENPLSYGAIKSAQLYSIKWLNVYFKGRLRLNSVSPGGIESINMSEYFKDKYKKKTLGEEFVKPDDVINSSEFLLSKKAESIYGQNLFVDYGFR